MSDAETVHPPHHEAWDVARQLNFNRRGEPMPLDACAVTEFGLYTKRRFARPHEHSLGMAAWLLPSLGLRVISWIPRPDVDRDVEDHYVDVAEITVDGDVWQMDDHYLDVLVWTGKRTEVLDQDEFVAAVRAGHLDPAAAETALVSAFHVLEGVTAHAYDLEGWLAATYGIELSWS